MRGAAFPVAAGTGDPQTSHKPPETKAVRPPCRGGSETTTKLTRPSSGTPWSILPSLYTSDLALPFLSQFRSFSELSGLLFNTLKLELSDSELGSLSIEQISSSSAV